MNCGSITLKSFHWIALDYWTELCWNSLAARLQLPQRVYHGSCTRCISCKPFLCRASAQLCNRVPGTARCRRHLVSICRAPWAAGVKCNPDYTALPFSPLIPKCSRLAGWLVRKGCERDDRLRPWEAEQPALVWPSPFACPADWLEERHRSRDRCWRSLHLFSPYADLVITFLWEFQILCGIRRASQETWEGITAYGELWY